MFFCWLLIDVGEDLDFLVFDEFDELVVEFGCWFVDDFYGVDDEFYVWLVECFSDD